MLTSIIGLSACSWLQADRSSQHDILPDWGYADLRVIDPPDAPEPEQDLLAVYLRRSKSTSNRLDIRLDFLEQPSTADQDILIAFDFIPGGATTLFSDASTDFLWDALLVLQNGDSINVFDKDMEPLRGMAVRVIRDPELDSVQISLDGSSLYGPEGLGIPPNIKIQAFTAEPNTGRIADRSTIAALSAPPPEPVRLLLAFWNSFPAYTPAQALRRWDGAHTGLFGGRDGLYNLLRAARNHEIPLVLLDIKSPIWLSSLDYAGDISMVKSMVTSGLVLAPDVWVSPENRSLSDYSVSLSERFGLPVGGIAYTQDIDSLPSRYQMAFVPSKADQPLIAVSRSSNRRVIPIPVDALQNNPVWRLDPTGLSMEARQLLASTASEFGDRSAILILGGDLIQSGWGSPEAARQAFRYLRNHPWIQVITPFGLRATPARGSFSGSNLIHPFGADMLPTDSLSLNSDLLIQAAAQGELANFPPFTGDIPEQSKELQRIYGTQGRVLLAAARWAQNPTPIAVCDLDLDGDGLPGCILASEKIYTAYNLELGALTHAFALGSDGPHQWIAPSSQLSFGTGEPSTLNLAAGLAADPSVIPGAFGDQAAENDSGYQAQIQPGTLTLTSQDGKTVKTFSLLDGGLLVKLEGFSSSSVRIPLTIDPWLRYQPGWGQQYHGQRYEDAIDWGTGDIQVRVTSPTALELSSFNDTRQMMGQVENPNSEYPPGHYMPFPLALVETSGENSLQVQFTIFTK